MFSAAKAAQGMQMSVSQSVTYLFVRFTSIFYNCKSYRNETNAVSKGYLSIKPFAAPCTSVLVYCWFKPISKVAIKVS